MEFAFTIQTKTLQGIELVREDRDQERELLYGYLNPAVSDYLSQFADFAAEETRIINTSLRSDVDKIDGESMRTFINLKRINDIWDVNNFFRSVNAKLPQNGIYIGCLEGKTSIKEKILNKYTGTVLKYNFLRNIFISGFLPVWLSPKEVLNLPAGSGYKSTQLPEILGRLIASGFQIINYKMIGGLNYFVVKKTGEPVSEEPSCGTIYKMKRIGKDKKTIYVYKIRTMHPYSEFLQQYVFEKYGTENGDKPSHDFRVTKWGKFLRKFWVDELPMLINLLKGEIKLVGVRPLSHHKFNMYPKPLQERRVKVKPGLIPPFYVHMPKTQEEFFEAEEKYLEEYEKNPLLTDMKYFFKAGYNILFKSLRSA